MSEMSENLPGVERLARAVAAGAVAGQEVEAAAKELEAALLEYLPTGRWAEEDADGSPIGLDVDSGLGRLIVIGERAGIRADLGAQRWGEALAEAFPVALRAIELAGERRSALAERLRAAVSALRGEIAPEEAEHARFEARLDAAASDGGGLVKEVES